MTDPLSHYVTACRDAYRARARVDVTSDDTHAVASHGALNDCLARLDAAHANLKRELTAPPSPATPTGGG